MVEVNKTAIILADFLESTIYLPIALQLRPAAPLAPNPLTQIHYLAILVHCACGGFVCSHKLAGDNIVFELR